MKIIDAGIRRRQILSIAIYGAIQMLSLISPYLMGLVIDGFIPNKNVTGICYGIVLFVTIPFLSIFLQTLYNYCTIKYVRMKGNQYALKIMENLVYQDMSFYDKENSLELLSYSSKEAVGYINFHIVEVSQYYVSMIVALITFFLLFSIDPLLGCIQVLYIPLAYYPIRQISKKVEKEVEMVVQKNAEINQVKGDVFKAIEFIKLYRLEKEKLHQVANSNSAINRVWGRIAALDSLSGIWASGFLTVLFMGVTFGLGAVLILSDSDLLQVGQLVSVITYGSLFYANINTTMQTSLSKKKQEVEYSKLFSYLELEGERGRNTGKKAFSFNDRIEFLNCSFSYDEQEPVLKDLSLVFKKGVWTGIVGTSGSGKSTLFDLIMKLYDAGNGSLFIDGADINDFDSFSIRDNITKITQDVFLFPGSIEDNLKLVNPAATLDEMRRALDFACLSEYVAALPNGLSTDVGEAGKLMSGGERQRLSIAMGLLRGNRVLLLDEVTSNLDPEIEAKLTENFRSLVQKGYTIISISHKLDFLKYADVIYKIDDGKAMPATLETMQ